MAEVDTTTQALTGLTERQQRGLIEVLDEVRRAESWSWQLPVLLRERCWLRLSRTPLTSCIVGSLRMGAMKPRN